MNIKTANFPNIFQKIIARLSFFDLFSTVCANAIVSLRNFVQRMLFIVVYEYLFNSLSSVIEYDLQFCAPAISIFCPRLPRTWKRQRILQKNIPHGETDQASDYSQNEIQTDCSPTFSFRVPRHWVIPSCHKITTSLQTKEYNPTRLTYERSLFRSLFLARRAQRGATSRRQRVSISACNTIAQTRPRQDGSYDSLVEIVYKHYPPFTNAVVHRNVRS